MSRLLMLFAALFFSHLTFAKDCGSFKKLHFTPASLKGEAIKRAKAGPYRLDAGDTPTVIFSAKTHKTCKVDAEIVSGDDGDAYWLRAADRMLYLSYSGSMQWATLVDPKTCKTEWKSKPNIGVTVRTHTLEIAPDCRDCEENGKFSGVCDCDSAEVWKLDANCSLTMDEAASKKLTESILHIGFWGRRKILGARSDGASFAN